MQLRVAKVGPTKGARFWGCSRYPKCQTIIEYQPLVSDVASLTLLELDIRRQITQAGLRFASQYLIQTGTDSYWLDLALDHPDRQGEYALAVEIDGRLSHTHSRRQQEYLEALGWRYHRISVADWTRDHDGEVRKLAAEHREAMKRTPMNPFELEIMRKLEKSGLEMVPQYEVSNFRLDFAVKHPHHPGMFVLAIEADGDSYHTSYKAQAHDKRRQETLERLGWRFHRIKSGDWFDNPRRETRDVIRAYEKALGLPPIQATS